MDISKAFDCISHDILILKMSKQIVFMEAGDCLRAIFVTDSNTYNLMQMFLNESQ